jgi:hypothetical protein
VALQKALRFGAVCARIRNSGKFHCVPKIPQSPLRHLRAQLLGCPSRILVAAELKANHTLETDHIMATIASPTQPLGHPARLAGCKSALRMALVSLIEAAEDAGWHGGEVACALNILVKSHIRQREVRAGEGSHHHHDGAWQPQIMQSLDGQNARGRTDFHRASPSGQPKRMAAASRRH